MTENAKFCLHCGDTLADLLVDGRTVKACAKSDCQFIHWNNPAPGAHVLAILDGRVLLVRRAKMPQKGLWCLPGGFMNSFESAEQAARRELFEETGLKAVVEKKNLLTVTTEGHNDIQIFYWTQKIVGGTLTLGDETMDLQFFNEHELPKDIAFESHRQVITNWFAAKGKSNLVKFRKHDSQDQQEQLQAQLRS